MHVTLSRNAWFNMWPMAKEPKTQELQDMNEPSRHSRSGMTLTVRVQVENNWKKWGRSKEDVGRRGHVRISRNDGGWGVREQHGVEARDNYC